ncbi:MAG: rhodanese-like domain-containing protein [Daejeonella sp.]
MDISATEFNARYPIAEEFIIIDVREELEYQTFNLGGDNIPLGILLSDVEDLNYKRDSEIVLICQHGLRSETARRVLAQNGYTNVRNLKGGLLAWRKMNTLL